MAIQMLCIMQCIMFHIMCLKVMCSLFIVHLSLSPHSLIGHISNVAKIHGVLFFLIVFINNGWIKIHRRGSLLKYPHQPFFYYPHTQFYLHHFYFQEWILFCYISLESIKMVGTRILKIRCYQVEIKSDFITHSLHKVKWIRRCRIVMSVNVFLLLVIPLNTKDKNCQD